MATLITGQSQLLTLQPSDKYTVTVGANTEAYIDLGAGTDGSGYDSVRLTSEGTNKYTIGEYGRVAKVTIRCVVGSVEYGYGVDGVSSQSTSINPNKLMRPFGRVEASSGVLGYTLHTTILSKTPFYGVRFKFVNAATSAIVSCKAAFATPPDNQTPCVTTSPWTNITVSGATTFTQNAAAANSFAITDSDVMQVTPVKRTDGDGYLLMIRLFVPAAGNTTTSRLASAEDVFAPATAAIDKNLIQAGAWSGDAISSPNSFVRTIVGIAAPVYVELFTGDTSNPVLMYVGDSITQGQGDTNNFQYGAAKQAANALGLIPYCGAIAGASSVNYVPFNVAQLPIVKPKYAALAPWSTNDTDAYTAGVENRINYNMAIWAAACQSAGAIPMLITPAPKNGITVGEETVRRNVVAAVKAFCASNGIVLIDRDAVYTNYDATTGGYKAGLNADTLHPNSVGYAAETPTWISAIGGAGK